MKSPLISIIIPAYNRAHLIGETLDSVLAQYYTNWECSVVDDGSIDETEQIVKKYCEKDSRIRFFKRPEHRLKGGNTCRNLGLEMATGSYIQLFDSDDIMHPELLKLQLENLEGSENLISICNFCFFRNLDSVGTTPVYNNFSEFNSNRELFAAFIAGKIVFNTQTAFFVKSLGSKIKFNEQLQRAQDLDFMFRLLFRNYEIVKILNEKLVYIRRHAQSITDKFKGRDLELIYDEVLIRENIWKQLVSNKFSMSEVQGATKMYLQSLKYLLYAKKYYKFYCKIGGVFKKGNVKSKMVIFKGAFFVMSHILIGKGATAYQKCINKLNLELTENQ